MAVVENDQIFNDTKLKPFVERYRLVVLYDNQQIINFDDNSLGKPRQ